MFISRTTCYCCTSLKTLDTHIFLEMTWYEDDLSIAHITEEHRRSKTLV